MSIRPRFAEAILRGEKRVEFRRRPIPYDVTHVIVYATQPRGAVVGAFEVDGLVAASPSELWQSFEEVAGIGLDQFWDYFGQATEGYALSIGQVFPANQDWDLKDDFGIDHPPQSYRYLEPYAVSKAFGWATDAAQPRQLKLT